MNFIIINIFEFYNNKYNKDYQGVNYVPYNNINDELGLEDETERDMDDLDKLELFFKINISVYTHETAVYSENKIVKIRI